MNLSGSTKLLAIIERYPFLLDFLAAYREHFTKLKNPVLRNTVGRFATLQTAATMGDVPLETFLKDLQKAIRNQTGETLAIGGAESGGLPDDKVAALKETIRDLHSGGDFAEIKARFETLVKDVAPDEIAQMEQQLISEGLPQEEIKRLCDVHVSIFKEALDKLSTPDALPGHPVHTFRAENAAFLSLVAEIRTALGKIGAHGDLSPFGKPFVQLESVEKHYLRKENQLFPFLEKHGITGPSQVMWAIHDDIRAGLKRAEKALAAGDVATFAAEIQPLLQMIEDMVYKEEHILFPMSLNLLEPAEWGEIQRGERAIGYALVEPGSLWKPEVAAAEPMDAREIVNRLALETGLLTLDQVNLMLTHLPLELSFVDENDEVRYYSQTPEKIFPRSPGVIGRKVQNCHPAKSVDIVNRIVTSFRDGTKDVAQFWMNLNDRTIHIRYFAVRDAKRNYRGCVEVVQDVTDIRALQGERRLLDWN